MNKKTKVILWILKIIPDYFFNLIIFWLKVGYFPNFKRPKSLNEKINFLKLYGENKIMSLFADRLKVRDYVVNKASNCKLINILWEGFDFSLDVYNSLPMKFVLKANHGSGMVKVVDKNYDKYENLKLLCDYWKTIDYGMLTRQQFYSKIEKKIIVEEFLQFQDGVPPDYKFFCLNGKVQFVQVDLNRFVNHTRLIFDAEFNKLDMKILYENTGVIDKPSLFLEAKEIAEQLSIDVDFLRVDLYILDDKIVFGELTNTPGNGFEPIIPQQNDFYYGTLLELKKDKV